MSTSAATTRASRLCSTPCTSSPSEHRSRRTPPTRAAATERHDVRHRQEIRHLANTPAAPRARQLPAALLTREAGDRSVEGAFTSSGGRHGPVAVAVLSDDPFTRDAAFARLSQYREVTLPGIDDQRHAQVLLVLAEQVSDGLLRRMESAHRDRAEPALARVPVAT